MRDVLVAQLVAARAQIDATLAVLGDGGDIEVACNHPEDKVENLSTMGSPLYRCKLCGAESDTSDFTESPDKE